MALTYSPWSSKYCIISKFGLYLQIKWSGVQPPVRIDSALTSPPFSTRHFIISKFGLSLQVTRKSFIQENKSVLVDRPEVTKRSIYITFSPLINYEVNSITFLELSSNPATRNSTTTSYSPLTIESFSIIKILENNMQTTNKILQKIFTLMTTVSVHNYNKTLPTKVRSRET